jgi:hypothetical protein
VKILDTSQKNVDGNPLREVMIDVLDKFPGYDLLSEEGVAEASRDIEATLSPVASFKEFEPPGGREYKASNG